MLEAAYAVASARPALVESWLPLSEQADYGFNYPPSSYRNDARPQTDQEEEIRAIAPAAKQSSGVVTCRSTVEAVAVYERCSAVISSTRVESKSIKVQEKGK
eukprot:IDg21220t1